LLDKKAVLDERELGKQRLTEEELDPLIGDRPSLDFLISKNELYRTLKMKEKPPSRPQALRLMAKKPNPIRRPIMRRGNEYVLGFVEPKLETLLK